MLKSPELEVEVRRLLALTAFEKAISQQQRLAARLDAYLFPLKVYQARLDQYRRNLKLQ